MNGLLISELAKKSHVPVETVRYYERRRLIPEPPRTKSGYRMFPFETVDHIKFIKRAQKMGFSLKEIEKLLAITEEPEQYNTKETLDFTTQKIREITQNIQDLERMKHTLVDLSAQCTKKGTQNCCPIIENLSRGGD